MVLQDLIDQLDALESGGPDAETPSGEIPSDLMEKAVRLPGGAEAIVERYSSSQNVRFPRAVSFVLSEIADQTLDVPPDATDPNLIFRLIEEMPAEQWQEVATQGNCVSAITQQIFNDHPWDPAKGPPPVLVPFLLSCLANPEREDVTLNAFWALHNWSADSGGLGAVLKHGERAAIRERIAALGLEAKLILDALGQD